MQNSHAGSTFQDVMMSLMNHYPCANPLVRISFVYVTLLVICGDVMRMWWTVMMNMTLEHSSQDSHSLKMNTIPKATNHCQSAHPASKARQYQDIIVKLLSGGIICCYCLSYILFKASEYEGLLLGFVHPFNYE